MQLNNTKLTVVTVNVMYQGVYYIIDKDAELNWTGNSHLAIMKTKYYLI